MAEEQSEVSAERDDVVAEKASFKWAHFIDKEDSWAIWLGFALLLIGLFIFLPRPPAGAEDTITRANQVMETEAARAPFKTVEWYQAFDEKTGLKATAQDYARTIGKWLGRPGAWISNPIHGLVVSDEAARAQAAVAQQKYDAARQAAAAALERARSAQAAAAHQGFNDVTANEASRSAIREWRDRKAQASLMKKQASASGYNKIGYLFGLCILLAVFFGIGAKFLGIRFGRFLVGFPLVFVVAVLAYLLAHQTTMNEYGIGYAAWAIVIGLLISNTVGTPHWARPGVQTEFYIKTGLVLLGAEVLFGKIVAIGIPGLFVAWVVTPIVLISTYILGNRLLRVPSKSLNITISSAVSVCGVSAAIATAAASKAKKEELTLAVGMSLIFTAAMMIVMPNIIRLIGMHHVLGGAWMGGTIDSTGAVAAAGAFLSDRALYVAATVKMIQNILIGLVAFAVAIYWCLRVEVGNRESVNAMELWYRLPKFVLGFVAASVIFSLIYESIGRDTAHYAIDNGVIGGWSKILRGWFFCLAFASIGLESNFRELGKYFKGGKPLILYVVGQSWNLILTLIIAYLSFFVIFPEITANI